MKNKGIDPADVLRKFSEPYRKEYGHLMLPSHRKAVSDIIGCMTPAMGGARYRCRDCDETFWSYHGCRNRSCPKCHGRQIVEWLEKRTAEMFPCDYFHLVATIPEELRPFFLKHQKHLYGLLMKTVAGTLIEMARDKKYIGATPAVMAVLHTWTSRMLYHPHVHLLVSAGGLSDDGAVWRDVWNKFLVPVKKLSPMIGQRFAETLKKEHPELFAQIPDKVWNKEWCSFCKHFGKSRDAVLRYLARYVFRIAITRSRILTMGEKDVVYRYKHHNANRWKTERVSGVEFIQRFLMHVLPKGFHKVRYYGLWSSPMRKRMRKAQVLLQLLNIRETVIKPELVADLAKEALNRSGNGADAFAVRCPKCRSENVRVIEEIRRARIAWVT